MKVILSRVGVDSSTPPGVNGASPVFDDGRFYSIPIPYRSSSKRYKDVRSPFSDVDAAELVSSLIRKSKDDFVHLDPDLSASSLPTRHPNWKPAYGQAGGAQGHLRNEGVGVGDLFLFYGRFRPVSGPPWRYRSHPEYKNGDLQAVWGWLRIGEIVRLGAQPIPPGNGDHPHCHGTWEGENVLYLAAPTLGLEGLGGVPGAGILPQLRPLTQRWAAASNWYFPRTYFSKQRQEHVADCAANPRVFDLAMELLSGLKPPSGGENKPSVGARS